MAFLPNLFGQSPNLIKGRKNPLPMVFRVKGIERASRIPPLFLIVDPGSMSLDYRKMTNTSLMRGGWLEEHWGEELDVLSAEGGTGGWFGPDDSIQIGPARRDTASYRNFKSLLALYKFNAGIRARVISRGRILQFGKIELFFDNGVYEGYFENFNYNEAADRPLTLEYSFSFKVTRTVLMLYRSMSAFNSGNRFSVGAGIQFTPGGLI